MRRIVVAETKQRADDLAKRLGVEGKWAFGTHSPRSLEGLIVDRVLIDEWSYIPPTVLEILHTTVAKNAGEVHWVSTRPVT